MSFNFILRVSRGGLLASLLLLAQFSFGQGSNKLNTEENPNVFLSKKQRENVLKINREFSSKIKALKSKNATLVANRAEAIKRFRAERDSMLKLELGDKYQQYQEEHTFTMAQISSQQNRQERYKTELELSDGQLKQVQRITTEFQLKRRELLNSDQYTEEQLKTMLKDLKIQHNAKLKSLLGEEKMEKFKKL